MLFRSKLGSSASKTVENAFADWSLAQMAKALGKDEDYKYFLERSYNYKNLIDTSLGYLRAKNSDGSWIEPFDPVSEEDYLTGLYNRRKIHEIIETEIIRSKRYNSAFSVILIDRPNYCFYEDTRFLLPIRLR